MRRDLPKTAYKATMHPVTKAFFIAYAAWLGWQFLKVL